MRWNFKKQKKQGNNTTTIFHNSPTWFFVYHSRGRRGRRVLSLFKDQLSPVKVIASKFIKVHESSTSVDIYHWSEIRQFPDNYCLVKSVEADLLKDR